ncbi:MAG: hypothetical protein JW891_14360 [Candidatus Lokiarchaeota archaeon]|nr:hypothetical protein [Candidatus Lokiarchaeota archaeon]
MNKLKKSHLLFIFASCIALTSLIGQIALGASVEPTDKYSYRLNMAASISLAPGEVYVKTISDAEQVDWSFNTNNQNVGLRVLAVSPAAYSNYLDGDPISYVAELSNGDYYADYGIWYPPNTGTWHIYFENVDSSTVTATIDVSSSKPFTILIIVVVIVVIAVVSTVIGIVIWKKKSKRKKNQSPSPE